MFSKIEKRLVFAGLAIIILNQLSPVKGVLMTAVVLFLAITLIIAEYTTKGSD